MDVSVENCRTQNEKELIHIFNSCLNRILLCYTITNNQSGQFFRADSSSMKNLVKDWTKNGWVAPWRARLGILPESGKIESGREDELQTSDFFGVPSSEQSNDDKDNVYIGVGGMHLLPRKILESSRTIVHKGARVSCVTSRTIESGDSNNNKKCVWDLTTTIGAAAFHDTKESDAKEALKRAKKEVTDTTAPASTIDASTITRIIVHRGFDAVVFTDISSSSESWHRASAGIPPSFTAKLPRKLRLPLFSCMIALEAPVRDKLPCDAFVVKSSKSSPLWFAAASNSKPGFPSGASAAAECWTLISTPSFAVDEIRETTMRDPVTGAFRPQENDYLNRIPGPMLTKAFFDLIQPYLGGNKPPQTVYSQTQRWGSGLPIDPEKVAPEHVHEICGTTYASTVKGSLVYSSPHSPQNFVADDTIGLYYGGDFCSNLNPGFEAAALSGLDLAKHILCHNDAV